MCAEKNSESEVQRTRKEKENEEKRESLIPADMVVRLWDDVTNEVTDKIMALSAMTRDILAKNSAVELSPEDIKQIEAAIEAEYKSALSELSRTGVPGGT